MSKALLAFLAVIGLSVRPAAADVVLFSNLGPNDSFNTGVSSFFGFDTGEEGSPDGSISRAMPFTSSATTTLTSLELALAFPFSFDEGTLQVNLFNEENGLPGTVLESFTRTEAIDGLLAFHSVVNPLLTAGNRYFVEATTTGRADGLWFFALKGHGLQTDYRRQNNGEWFVGTRDFTSAFRVSGVGTAATPEPASLLLLGTGLALAGWRRRGARPASR